MSDTTAITIRLGSDIDMAISTCKGRTHTKEYAGKEIHRGTAGTVPNREGDQTLCE